MNDDWQPMGSAPRDGTTIIGRYPDGEVKVRWSERPVCMLGTRCGGFPAGWATPPYGDVDSNLPMDAPEAWRNEE